mgnify:CR=1 FL=1
MPELNGEEVCKEVAEKISGLGTEGFEEKEGWIWVFDREKEQTDDVKKKVHIPGVGEICDKMNLDIPFYSVVEQDDEFKAIHSSNQAWRFSTTFVKQLYLRSVFGEEDFQEVADELIRDAKKEESKLKAYSLLLKPDVDTEFKEELKIDDDFELREVSHKEAELLYNSLGGGLMKERLGNYLGTKGTGYFYIFEKKFSRIQRENQSPSEEVENYTEEILDKASDFDAALILNDVDDVSHTRFQLFNQATKAPISSIPHNLTAREGLWVLGKHYSESIENALETYNQINRQEKSRGDGINLALRRLLSAKRKDNIEDELLDLCIAIEAIASMGREGRFDWSVRVALALEQPEVISELDALWDKRNDIAHGNYQPIEREDIDTLQGILVSYLNEELEYSSKKEQSLKDSLEIERVRMNHGDNSEVEEKINQILDSS